MFPQEQKDQVLGDREEAGRCDLMLSIHRSGSEDAGVAVKS